MKGHIRERSPGRWAIVLDVRDPATGKRKRKWHRFEGTKRQAQTECSRLITEMNSGAYVEPGKTTLAQFLEHWLEHMKGRISPRSHERYCEIIRKNVIPLLGSVPITKLRPAQISGAYIIALAAGRRNGAGGLSSNTVVYMHRLIRQALAHAVRWGMIARNAADAVDLPKVERGAMTTYDLPQTAELLETARGTRLLVPVLLGVLCGLRRGEIAALRWRNVDLAGAQLAIVQSAEQTQQGVRYKEPKSGRARTVALSAIVIEELRLHRLRQAEELLRIGVRQTDATFSMRVRMVSRCSRAA
jgi:integrase